MFSLAVQNHDGDMAGFDNEAGRGVAALRTCVLVRDRDGNDALGHLYTSLASARHDRAEDLDDHDVIRGALGDAGLPADRLDDALADHTTFERLVADHCALVERTAAFGVPAILLDGGTGPAIFGPVISNPTETDDEARALWDHTAWLTRYENFSELKRDRIIDPDLESYRSRRRKS